MVVDLNSEQEAQLSQLAACTDRDADELASEAIARYLEDEDRFIKAVEDGMNSLGRGEYVEHAEVWARIERLFQS